MLAQLKKDYETWFADVSSTRPNNYAPPRVIVGTKHENPTVLTRQDWLGTTWSNRAMGHWVVDVATAVTAQIEVLFHPNVVTANQAAITLKVGNTVLRKQSKTGSIQFDDIKLAKGELKLEAIRQEGGLEVGAYQLIVTTDIGK